MNSSNTPPKKQFLKAVIMVGHSNAGKSSICQYLIKRDRKIAFSVSATTRPIRTNEVNGKDYMFLSTPQFTRFIDEGMFAEYDHQNTGHFYGTLWSEIDKINNAGKTCLLDVNPVGADNLIKHFGSEAITIFITVPGKTPEEKIEVLRNRASNSVTRDDFESRIARVYDELRWANERQIEHFVENTDLDYVCEYIANAIGFVKKQMRRNSPILK